MTAFRFVGDPRHKGEGPDAVTMFGKTFGRTHGTDVTDPAAIRKLAGNPHFEAVALPDSVPAGDDTRVRKTRKRKGAPA